MVRDLKARRRSRFAICRDWSCWALLTIAAICFWVLVDGTAYPLVMGLF